MNKMAIQQALVRALCLVEWEGVFNGTTACCPACSSWQEGTPAWATQEMKDREPKTHLSDCFLDAALTIAGLTTKDRETLRTQLERP